MFYSFEMHNFTPLKYYHSHLITQLHTHTHQLMISSSLLTSTIWESKRQCLLSQIPVYSVSERRLIGQPFNTLIYPPPKTFIYFLLLGFRHTLAYHLNQTRQLQCSILCIVVKNFGKKNDILPDHDISSNKLSLGLIQLMIQFLGCVQPYLQRFCTVRIM